jgi:Cft2 family RNA processing exonuclease
VDNYFQVSIQPIRAGKSIGACAWKISINMITVVFVTDFSTLKELHVDPIAVDRLLSHTN